MADDSQFQIVTSSLAFCDQYSLVPLFIHHHPPSHPEPGWSPEAEEAIQSLDKQLQSEPRFQQTLKDTTLPKGATAQLRCLVNGRVTELWCTSLNYAPPRCTPAMDKGKKKSCLKCFDCSRMRPKPLSPHETVVSYKDKPTLALYFSCSVERLSIFHLIVLILWPAAARVVQS